MKKPRCQRYHSLDMWRGFACLLVIVFHSTYYVATKKNDLVCNESLCNALAALCARMWIGVPIFFVISGYCISATADSTRLKGHATRTYFWRRFRRIFPPYWIFLIFAAIGVGVIDYAIWPRLFSDSNHSIMRPWWLEPRAAIGNVTLTATWLHYFIGGSSAFFMGHAWTLCYEEQFYAVVGVALLVARRWFFLFMAFVSALILCLNIIFPDSCRGFFFDGKWTYFALGILVYYDGNHASRVESWCARSLLVAGMIYATVGLGDLYSFRSSPGQELLVASSFAAILIVARNFDTRLTEFRATRVLTWCGTMCYSLYLVHWPIVKGISHSLYIWGITSVWGTLLLTVPLCVSVSLVVGWNFHMWIERRFLNTRQSSEDEQMNTRLLSPNIGVSEA